MIISRGFNGLKLLTKSYTTLQPSLKHVINRSSSRWAYRSLNLATEKQHRMADMLGGLIWGWIIYHCINDYGHIIGEYNTPDPSLWTDEELGIPPDDAGSAK